MNSPVRTYGERKGDEMSAEIYGPVVAHHGAKRKKKKGAGNGGQEPKSGQS